MNKPLQTRLGDDPGEDMIEMIGFMRKLSADLHTVKIGLATNSELTQATLDKQLEQQNHQAATDKKLDDLAKNSEEMLAVFNAGKKGVSFFQWIGKTLYSIARWAGPILAVGGALWAVLHGQLPTKGSE